MTPAVLVAAAALATASGAERPNIVILLADDWGFTDVGAFGGEIRTPHLDALAMQGVRFSNFHVAGSCSPTRAMLQTGVSSHRAGLGNMPETIPAEHVGKPGYGTVMNGRVVTIAQMLRGAGYRTYLTGKWHLGKTADKLPHARGYDRAFALADAGADNFEHRPIEGLYETADWTENGKPARLPEDYYSSRFIVDKTIEYIGRGGKPFLASVNFLANHIPVQAPDAYIARYAGTYTGGWSAVREARRKRAVSLGIVPVGTRAATIRTTRDWSRLSEAERTKEARAMAAYAGMAEAMDHEVGRLVGYLKRIGAYQNTIFVFLSDNGAEPTDPMGTLVGKLNTRYHYDTDAAAQGRPGSFTAIGPSWASAAAAPLRGYKFSAGEGGLRVPLIVAWPGNPAVRRGRIAGRFTHVTDVMPTLLELARVPAHDGTFAGRSAEPIMGVSLVPMLTGAADAVHAAGKPIGYELSGNGALFNGDHKLVKNLPPTGDGGWRLYDIVADPGETNDLSAAEPRRFRAMIAEYEAFATREQVLPMPEGYSAGRQIAVNGFRNNTLPRLKRALPATFIVFAAVTGAIVWMARRRRHRA